MLRYLFRTVGLLLLACAFAAIIVDGTRSIAANAPVASSLGQAMLTFLPAKLPLIENAAERVHPLLRNPGLLLLMRLPVWLLTGTVGAFLMLLTRPRRPVIGFSSR